MKKGAYIINTARGKICNREDAKALKSGQISGYRRRLFPQPAPNDHVGRSMPNVMTPHTWNISNSSI